MFDQEQSPYVLVTGGAGYIGSHVCRALEASGLTPVTYDNLSHGHAWAVQWGPLEVGDLTDRERLQGVLRQYRPQAVIHLAGLIAAGQSVLDPTVFYRNNVVATLALLDAMRACEIRRLVFSSSAGVYGEPDQIPIGEDHPQRPVNPYGATKSIAERMLADFAGAYSLKSVSLRYFNAVGAAPEGTIGEAHPVETHLVPLVLDVAAGVKSFVEIYGDDFPTKDGTCIRDYVHVCDLADAHILALAHLSHDIGVAAFNLGSDTGASVREVIDTAIKVTKRPIEARVKARRPGDPAVLVADSTLARQVLGWCPAYATLEQQIKTAWDWHDRYRQNTTERPKVLSGSSA
jgi:UDP-arabinose 4-epimerase